MARWIINGRYDGRDVTVAAECPVKPDTGAQADALYRGGVPGTPTSVRPATQEDDQVHFVGRVENFRANPFFRV